jgi:hypothetical protein
MHGVTLGQWMEPDERCAYVALDDVDGGSPPLTPDIGGQSVRAPPLTEAVPTQMWDVFEVACGAAAVQVVTRYTAIKNCT